MGPGKPPSRKLFVFVLLAGVCMLGLLSTVPLWNALLMLRDPIYMWFLSDAAPGAIVTFFPSVALLYVFAVIALWGRAPLEAQKQRNVLLLGTFFITILGAGCLLLAGPLRRTGEDFSQHIFATCTELGTLNTLTSTSRELIHLRESSPECARKPSVELCEGFNRSSYTRVLKAMEENLHCSGWCHKGSLALAQKEHGVGGGSSSSDDVASLMQRGAAVLATPSERRPQTPRAAGGKASFFAGAQLSKGSFPPTLFSLANYEATCDGMAARSIRGVLTDTADELFIEGVVLMSLPVAVGFLVILGSGSMPPPSAATFEDEAEAEKRRSLGSDAASFAGEFSAAGYGSTSFAGREGLAEGGSPRSQTSQRLQG